MTDFRDSTHLPDETLLAIAERTQEMHLLGILNDWNKQPPLPSNTRAYRQWSAGMKCMEFLLGTTLSERTALITLTARSRNAKKANKAFSRILEKQIGPSCSCWVRFFHRSKKGFTHWHIIVALKFPVLNTDHEFWTSGEQIRRELTIEKSRDDGEAEMENALSAEALAMQNRCCAALRKAKIGYKARIEAIIYPHCIAGYLARYLCGVVRSGRCAKDMRLRLWSASKNARVANADVQVMTQWSRICRLKSAAYCASQGWRSMEEARQSQPKWNWDSRTFLLGKKLRTYLYEMDYIREWGHRWSPSASGVLILYPAVRPGNGMVFQYFHNERPSDVNDLAALQQEWNEALPVPLDIWFGKRQ